MTHEDMIATLNNVGLLLNVVDVKGEMNLNNLLAAIQQIRNVRNALKEETENADHNNEWHNV